MLYLATITFVLLTSLVLATISAYPPDNMEVEVGTIATETELMRLSFEEFRITQIYEDEKGDWFVIDLESKEFWAIVGPLKADLAETVVLSTGGAHPSLAACPQQDIEALWEEAIAYRDALRAAQADGMADCNSRTRRKKRKCPDTLPLPTVIGW